MNMIASRLPAVLLVEDEFIIRLDLSETMRRHGFTAYEAANADDAMDILESRPDISVVFTDVNMPGSMDGLSLSQLIARRWPHIRVVVTSGRAPPPAEQMAGVVAFVPKPYRVAELPTFFQSIAPGC
jgi:two-component system, response regulator PdtaR